MERDSAAVSKSALNPVAKNDAKYIQIETNELKHETTEGWTKSDCSPFSFNDLVKERLSHSDEFLQLIKQSKEGSLLLWVNHCKLTLEIIRLAIHEDVVD